MLSFYQNYSLKKYNSFGLDVSTRLFVTIKSLEDFLLLLKTPEYLENKSLILGGGSNILFCNNYDGLVIKNEIVGIRIIKEDESHIWLTAFSGTNWNNFVMYCVEHGYGGLENLSLIPGTVGAAPIQNIGAYGVEMKDCFEELEAIELTTGDMYKFDKELCAFGYRDSIFKCEAKGQYFIYSVTFKLSKRPEVNTKYGDIQKILQEENKTNPTVKEVSDAVVAIRKSKLPDPNEIGNAGSFFKNPEISKQQFELILQQYPGIPHYILPENKIKIPAAWLIEQCGWKGKHVGNTGNHARQALVIVNYGNASGSEIWQHAQQVQQSVLEKFGITLEAEVNMVG